MLNASAKYGCSVRVFIAVFVLLVSQSALYSGGLFDAVSAGDRAAVEQLLKSGADVNERTYNDFRPLHLTEDPAMVELLLRCKPELNPTSIAGTPLQNAAAHVADGGSEAKKWRQITKLLIDAGAEYDLISAICFGDVKRARAILKKSPKAALRHKHDESPLRVAAREGREEICRLLLEYKADPEDVERGNGFTIIQEAVKYPRIVKLLIDAGADPKRRITWVGGRTGWWVVGDDATALHYAAGQGVPETVKLLIDRGVDIFAVTHSEIDDEHNDQTALEVSAVFGKADNANAIVIHPKFDEADPKLRKKLLDKSLVIGATPVSVAGDWNAERSRLVEVLLKKGADPNARWKGHTALQMSAREISPEHDGDNTRSRKIVDILRHHGATVDLYSAVAIGDESEVDRLLKRNPKLASACGPDGCPALHMAVAMDNVKLVKKLLAAGCDVNIRSRTDEEQLDETALFIAAFWGRYEVAKLLIDAGAAVNAKAENKTTPLSEAIRLHQPRLVRLFLEHGAKRTSGDDEGATAEMGRVLDEFSGEGQ